MNVDLYHRTIKIINELNDLLESVGIITNDAPDDVPNEDELSSSFFGQSSKEIKPFELYECRAADMVHGFLSAKNQEGYDIVADGYKYQVKFSNETRLNNNARGRWQFDFRLTNNPENRPDFCILYGIDREINLFCFLIPYEKVIKEMSFRGKGNTEGRLSASVLINSWIWDWRLMDESYESFILKRDELSLYRQLSFLG